MQRHLLCAVVVAGLAGGSATSQAEDLLYRMHVDFHRNNCWPQPFQAADRELVRAPLIAMTAAGWRLNNTLSDHFFHAETQALNQAGELKLRWIVTQAPPHRRSVFVLRGASGAATESRVAAVEEAMNKLYIEGPRPPVMVTSIIPPGASGDYFDQVERQLRQSIPAPRLPVMESTSGEN